MSITQNFILSGPPTGLSARSGVVAWDIQFNTKYIQTTIPAGSHWVILSKNQYYTGNGGDADTLNGHPGSYYLDLTNATNLLPYTKVSGLATVAHSGDYNDLSNKIALTTVGTSGAATLVGSTLNIPQYSEGGGGGVTSVSGTAPVVSSGGTTPAISIPKATSLVDGYLSSTDWTTFNNKGSGTVTSVSGTSPLSSSGGTTPAISIADAKADGATKGAAAFATNDFNDNGAGVVSIDYTNGQAASGSTKGFLTSADWTTFNNKGSGTVTSVSASAPLTSSGGASPNIAIPAATTLVDGYLLAVDWNTFNNKQNALGFTPPPNTRTIGTTAPLSGGGDLTANRTLAISKADTTTDGYLSSTDWNTFNNKGSGTVTSVSGTSPLASSGGTTPAISIADAKADGATKGAAAFTASDFNDNGSGLISLDYTNGQKASASVPGFLSSADWTTFNNKGSGTVTSVSGTAPIVSSGGATPAISIPAATGSVDGYLSATDWTTFNNKQAALGFTPENVTNKSTTTTLGTSNTLYPTQNAVKTYVDTQVATALTANKAMQAFLM